MHISPPREETQDRIKDILGNPELAESYIVKNYNKLD